MILLSAPSRMTRSTAISSCLMPICFIMAFICEGLIPPNMQKEKKKAIYRFLTVESIKYLISIPLDVVERFVRSQILEQNRAFQGKDVLFQSLTEDCEGMSNVWSEDLSVKFKCSFSFERRCLKHTVWRGLC